MHTLQPHLCSTPVLTTQTSCTRRCANRIHQDSKYLLNVRSAPLNTADGQRQRFTCVQSSSQPHVELDNEAASAEDGLITLDATVEALLSAETEAEGEELADFDVFESGHINQQELQQEENPYSPADAASPPRPYRLGAPQPAAPELEQFLADTAASDGQVTIEQLQALFPFQLDGFQEKAVEQLLEGRSVVVCAPTGAGKTAIAEAAAAATLARGQRVIYTTPLKALSNQKLAEKSARFGSSRCGLQTGDTSLNTEADIVVMTTEILRNIMYRTAEVVGGSKTGGTRDERLGDVGLIVLDEVHYLGDPWRGSVWEEVIINCPRHIQLLAMSATVKNPDDLGGWISAVHGECATIKTSFRPVPLRWVFCNKVPRKGTVFDDLLIGGSRNSSNSSSGKGMRLNPRLRMDEWVQEEKRFQAAKEAKQALLQAQQLQQYNSGLLAAGIADESGYYIEPQSNGNGGGKFKRERDDTASLVRRVMGKRTPAQDQVIRQLQQNKMLPAIWFILSRRDCDQSAINSNVVLVNKDEEAELVEELQQLYSDNPDAVRVKLVPAFLKGVSSHHAGCLPAWKSLVERCFQKGLLKLVFATGTLAAGINMPARTTIISNLARKSDDGVQLLPHNELLQMAGRAGRRGYDTLGHCVIVQGRYEGAEAAHDIIAAGPEPLLSQFTTSYSLVLNLCSVYSLDEAREFLSKSFGTYLTGEGTRNKRQEAQQLIAVATKLIKLAKDKITASDEQQAAAAAVKAQKSVLRTLRDRANQERCEVVQQLLVSQQQQQPDPQASEQLTGHDDLSNPEQQAAQQKVSRATVGLPALLLLNLSKHPNDDTQPAQLLPALAVQIADSCPLPPVSVRDTPQSPIIMCLGADNRPMAVSAQHVVGIVQDQAVLQDVLSGQEDTLQRLQGILDDAAQNPKVWANLTSKMFSCQVSFGSTLTSALAIKLNLPSSSFQSIDPQAATLQEIEHNLVILEAAKQRLKQAQQQERQQTGQIDPESLLAALQSDSTDSNGSTTTSSSISSTTLNPSQAMSSDSQEVVEAAIRALQSGADPISVGNKMVRRAKKLVAESDEITETTWNSFMAVLGILVDLGAMEAHTLRLLPLGLVARSINCNNELWMAAALSDPAVMDLTPPQLAAFVGALQCTDLLKRPMSIWSSFQVSDAVVSAIEQLEPWMESIYQAQTAAGQTRWNEHLAVDLRLAGLVEAWAGGASWQEIMIDTSIDDGDMARLLARTADMLKQMTFLDEQLPHLVTTARAALKGMDRKPISDLVA